MNINNGPNFRRKSLFYSPMIIMDHEIKREGEVGAREGEWVERKTL